MIFRNDYLYLYIIITFFIDGVDQSYTPNRITVEVYLVGEPVTRDYTALRVYNPAMHTV